MVKELVYLNPGTQIGNPILKTIIPWKPILTKMSFRQRIAFHLVRNLPWYSTLTTTFLFAIYSNVGFSAFSDDTVELDKNNPNIAVMQIGIGLAFELARLLGFILAKTPYAIGGALTGCIGGHLLRTQLKKQPFYRTLKTTVNSKSN